MQQLARVSELRETIDAWRNRGLRIAFVPTMGNLHAGHFSLIEEAKRHADCVVASVFVNPTQFGPKEDFSAYPRTPDADRDGLQAAGCDLLWMPSLEDLYPFGSAGTVKVEVPDALTETLCGLSRPGHFTGVATVVCKLFYAVQPDVAVFGMKDFQQVMVIRRMVEDLLMPIQIVTAPTRREANGLAMSSRNQYLSAEERERAGIIHRSLCAIRDGIKAGHTPADLRQRVWDNLIQAGLSPDYVEIRNASDLQPPAPDQSQGLVALIAAKLGRARLIDNLLIE